MRYAVIKVSLISIFLTTIFVIPGLAQSVTWGICRQVIQSSPTIIDWTCQSDAAVCSGDFHKDWTPDGTQQGCWNVLGANNFPNQFMKIQATANKVRWVQAAASQDFTTAAETGTTCPSAYTYKDFVTAGTKCRTSYEITLAGYCEAQNPPSTYHWNWVDHTCFTTASNTQPPVQTTAWHVCREVKQSDANGNPIIVDWTCQTETTCSGNLLRQGADVSTQVNVQTKTDCQNFITGTSFSGWTRTLVSGSDVKYEWTKSTSAGVPSGTSPQTICRQVIQQSPKIIDWTCQTESTCPGESHKDWLPLTTREGCQNFLNQQAFSEFIKDSSTSGKVRWTEKTTPTPIEQKTTPVVLLLVEDKLADGLKDELNTYSQDVNNELGFQTVVKTFPSSASVFDVKSYIKNVYNSQNLNGVLLIGDITTAKFYAPNVGGVFLSQGLTLYDSIYQDVYDQCVYSQQKDAFDYTSSGCRDPFIIEPFWVSRLTPFSSSKDSLTLLKDYFHRNHAYRTGQYSYQNGILIYTPILKELTPDQKAGAINQISSDEKFLQMNTKEGYAFIDIQNPNSGASYLSGIKNTPGYEIIYFNGHGAPTTHQAFIGTNEYIGPNDVVGANFFYATFGSCSVGRFTTQDYMVGKYLFEGKGLIAAGASTPIFAFTTLQPRFTYELISGEPFYQAVRDSSQGAVNMFGDLTLKMRYASKSSAYQANDPHIQVDKTNLVLTKENKNANNPNIEKELISTSIKIENLGRSDLLFDAFSNFKRSDKSWMSSGLGGGWVTMIKVKDGVLVIPPSTTDELTVTVNYNKGSNPDKFTGEFVILSNDPVKPVIRIPFQINSNS